MSQLAKYDLFTDVIFSATAYGCGHDIIALLSAITVAFNIWAILVGFIIAFKNHLSKSGARK